VFANLRQSVEQLQRTSASAAEMTANLNETSTKLNDDKNAVGVLLNDQQFATQLKGTMENLETSTDKLDENMEALQHNFLFRGYFKRKAKREQQARQAAQHTVDTAQPNTARPDSTLPVPVPAPKE
jgi:phospholipid/cholesterol/gamma-HCH transport system substrate-binding protein